MQVNIKFFAQSIDIGDIIYYYCKLCMKIHTKVCMELLHVDVCMTRKFAKPLKFAKYAFMSTKILEICISELHIKVKL